MRHAYTAGLALIFFGVATCILVPGALFPGSLVALLGFTTAAIAAKAGE